MRPTIVITLIDANINSHSPKIPKHCKKKKIYEDHQKIRSIILCCGFRKLNGIYRLQKR